VGKEICITFSQYGFEFVLYTAYTNIHLELVSSCVVRIRNVGGKIEKWFYEFRQGNILV